MFIRIILGSLGKANCFMSFRHEGVEAPLECRIQKALNATRAIMEMT